MNAVEIANGRCEWRADPDVLDGLVSDRALPNDVAREMAQTFRENGYEASTASDNEGQARSWLYVV